MKRRYLILHLLLAIGGIFSSAKAVYAQAPAFSLNPTLDNITPPSPNASALMKFGSIPVGAATGIPNISIPIYDFKSNASGLKLAVSLDYHASGIKVSEVGSNVGIGWVLNAGGAVSRTLRGIYDELPDVGFIDQPTLPYQDNEGNSPSQELFRPFTKLYSNRIDGQPDIFNFNMNGKSGTFMFGKNNDFLMQSMQRVKVEKVVEFIQPAYANSGYMITKFILTDEEGFRYFFESYEITSNYSLQGVASRDYTSSWYLTKQLAPNNKDSIIYTYEPTAIPTYIVARSAYKMEPVRLNGGGSYKEGTSSSTQSILGQRIKNIKLPDEVTINFEYKPEQRTDLPGDHLLNKITINYGSDKRGFYLEQDYSLNRATLKKVIPFNGAAEVKIPPYQFEYGIPLPDRLSFAQDHWGYYNANSGGGLIPQELFPGKIENFYRLEGSNRDTDSTLSLAGSIKKVIYPTGGYTVFEMEPNKAYSNWLDQKFVTTEPGIDKRTMSRSGYVSSSDPYKSNYATVSFDGIPNSVTPFRITSYTSGTCNGNCKIMLEVYSPTGSLIAGQEIPYNPNTGADKSFNLPNLVKGDYKFVMYTTGLTGFSTYVNVEWVETIVPQPISVEYAHKQPFVGGLRVKTIADYTHTGGQPIAKRSFEYLAEDGVTSSGSLGVTPRYSFAAFYHYRLAGLPADAYEDYAQGLPKNYISRSSSPVNDLTYTSGSPVTYKRVVEKQENNGRIERYFTSFNGGGAIIEQEAPFVPTDYKPWLYGLETKELVYDNSNALVKKTEREFQYQEDYYFNNPTRMENFRGISLLPVKYYFNSLTASPIDRYWDFVKETPIYFLHKDFYPSSGRANMTKETVYTYDKDGNSLIQETNSSYDPDKYYLKSSWMLNSTKDTVLTTMNYPADLSSAGADAGIYQAMVQRNMINMPLEKRLFVAGKQIGLTKTNYYNPFTNLYVPKSVQFKKGNDSIETRINFQAYDNQGRILERRLDDGPAQSYKWGYNKQYVIAECKNALTDEFFYTGFEEDGTTSNAHTGTRSFSGTFTTTDKLTPGLHGKKYVISYWTYTNGKWNYSNELAYTGQVLSGILDDIRIYPENAQMTSYTYHPMFGVESITDVRGLSTYYEYDAAGNLRAIKDEDGKIQKLFDYQYQQSLTR